MTQASATQLSVLSPPARWRQWEMNPIVVKELRQAVRSWAVTGTLMIFLIILFIAIAMSLITESADHSSNLQMGGTIFMLFMGILTAASMLFIPLYTGIRMASERQENNADLLYISTLSPAGIIWGKFVCGAYITLLFFSACMPFMAFTNLLRGVDLPTIFLNLAFLFGVVCAMNQAAIFLACLPMTRLLKLLLTIGGFIVSFAFMELVLSISDEMLRSGMGSLMGRGSFWLQIGTIAGILAGVTGLFFVLSVALISPPSANRAPLPRIYLTALLIFGGFLAFYWGWSEKDSSGMMIWIILSLWLLILSVPVVISNSDQLTRRVRRAIPKSPPLRAPALLFFNGAVGGLIWTIALSTLIFFTAQDFDSLLAGKTYGSMDSFSDCLKIYPGLMAYVFAYALTGLFIHRQFLHRRPAKWAGVFAVIISAVAALWPTIYLFITNQLASRGRAEEVELGSAINLCMVTSDGDRAVHLDFAGGWLLIAICVNAPWFFRQIRNFRPAEAVVPAPAAQ